MNIKLKMSFIIITTLALGIVIGAMVNRTLSQNRIRNILSKRKSDIFVSIYEKILQPEVSQHELIRKILEKYASRVSEIHANFRQDMESSIESMRKELDPILKPAQKKRLERGLRLLGRPLFQPRFLIEKNVYKEISALKEALDLSKDQASQVKHILKELRDQGKVMREERGSSKRRWQIMKEIEEKKEKAIEKILTKEQKKLYEQIKKERFKKIEEEMRKRRQIMKGQGSPRF